MVKKKLRFMICLIASVTMPSIATATGDYRQNTVNVSESGAPSVSASAGAIELSCGAIQTVKFQIFSITGQLVKSVTVTGGTVKIELPKGFYIVKCESWTRRVMVK